MSAGFTDRLGRRKHLIHRLVEHKIRNVGMSGSRDGSRDIDFRDFWCGSSGVAAEAYDFFCLVGKVAVFSKRTVLKIGANFGFIEA